MQERIVDIQRDILKPDIPKSGIILEVIDSTEECVNDTISKDNVPFEIR